MCANNVVTTPLINLKLVVFIITGVLVYLHYKNAYDYWMEQRIVLTSEVDHIISCCLQTDILIKVNVYKK